MDNGVGVEIDEQSVPVMVCTDSLEPCLSYGPGSVTSTDVGRPPNGFMGRLVGRVVRSLPWNAGIPVSR